MKVLVTGGAGFIGSHLVDALVEQNHEVTILDNLHRGKLQNVQRHLDRKRLTFIKGDIRNYNEVAEICNGCDTVFHLAAQSNVMGAVTDLDYSFQSNVVGTYNVLKATKECGVRRVIFSSSRETYGEAQYLPVDEEHPLLAKNPYGASKISGEVYCEVIRKMGLEVYIFRLANVYGTRDYDRVIPIFLESLKTKKPIRIFGGDQIIDFISVDFIVQVFLQSMEIKYEYHGPINVGSGMGTNLFELVKRLEQVTGLKTEVQIEASREVEVRAFTAKVDKLERLFSLRVPADPLKGLQRMW